MTGGGLAFARGRGLGVWLLVLVVLTVWVIDAQADVTTRLDWDSVNYSSGALSQTYPVGSGNVSLRFSGATGALINNTPQINQRNSGSLTPVENSLDVFVDYPEQSSDQITLTIDFAYPQGVRDLSFTLFDIDADPDTTSTNCLLILFCHSRKVGFIDRVQVTGRDASGGRVLPSRIIPGTANHQVDSVTVEGDVASAPDSPAGNASFSFIGAALTGLTLVYSNARPNDQIVGGPRQQAMALHDLDFTIIEPPPEIVATKSVETASDPVNGTLNPKAIPGSVVQYTIQNSNRGTGQTDSGSVEVTDAIPTNTELFVGDLDGTGTGPLRFIDGTPASGLSYTFDALSNTSDDLAFSNNNGTSFDYSPQADGGGFDSQVTDIRVNPKGTFKGASGGRDPSFKLQFRVRVK